MSCVGFKPTIPASERTKTVHALDRAATVTGSERAKTVHALDRPATVTGSERAKTVHALDRAATVTGGYPKGVPLIPVPNIITEM
jgi:hypothetical protein